MDIKHILEQLTTIHSTFPVTAEQKEALEYAIKKLKRNNNKETLIEVAKLLVNLLGAGSKFFDP